MNWFVKYMLIPGLAVGATVGASVGTTLHINNKKHKEDYNLGYENALTNESYYKSQVEEYKALVTEQNSTIQDYLAKVNDLNQQCNEKQSQIDLLNADIQTKAARIKVLESENSEYQSIVDNLQSEKTNLQNKVIELTTSNTEKTAEIAQLNIKISNLQSQINSYQTLMEVNTQTISTLNSTITKQQEQIGKLQQDLQQATLSSKQYTDKIAELEKTITYLESYVSGTLEETQASVKFIFANSLYNMQVVTKNSCASVEDPKSTKYIKFNYWMKDGQKVTVSETPITEDTVFVANVTYYYDVKFINGDSEIETQLVESGHYATKPAQDPAKEGYVFDGYTINGIDVVDPTQTEITGTTIFTAKFTKIHTVKYNDGSSDVSTQQIRDGETSTKPIENPTKDGFIFDGWTIEGALIADPNTYHIFADTTFTAKWTQVHTVTYNVDGQQTTEKVRHGEYIKNLPANTNKDGHVFDGWLKDGQIVDPNSIPINEDTTFTAKFSKMHTVTYDINGSKTTEQVKDGEYVKDIPINTARENYDFDGWLKNGILTEPRVTAITEDTTFTAKYTRLYNVTFNDGVKTTTIKVREGEKAEAPIPSYKKDMEFESWMVNNENIDVGSWNITSDTLFTAKYYYQMDGDYKLTFHQIGSYSNITVVTVDISIVENQLNTFMWNSTNETSVMGATLKSITVGDNKLYPTFSVYFYVTSDSLIDVSYTFSFDKYKNVWTLTSWSNDTYKDSVSLVRV